MKIAQVKSNLNFWRERTDLAAAFRWTARLNMHEAVADAEGIDLSQFLQTEQQLAAISKDKKTVRNFRDTEFVKMGFSELYFLKNGQE